MICMLMSMVDTPEDKRKVEMLYKQYNRLMYVVAYHILNNNEDAEDVVIESWEKIIRNLDKINEIVCQETKSFIVIIVERTAIDLYRKNVKKSKSVLSLSEYDASPFIATNEKELDNIELYETMRHISKKYVEVLILYYINGLTGKEMAALLGIKEDTVMKRLSRAREMLREEMKTDD